MSTVIKATIYEKYIYSNNGHKRLGLLENEIETRFFSSFEKYQEWYETFKSKLWQDDQNNFDLAEGTYFLKFDSSMGTETRKLVVLK